jgi:WD40 repeat protein
MRHNIPCLQFSPCGEFLCATSIDEHVRIFRTSDGALLREVRTDEWGWTVNWILKTDVTNFSTESEVFYSTSHK